MQQIPLEELRRMMAQAQSIRQQQKVCIDINHLVKIGPPPYEKVKEEQLPEPPKD